MRPERGSYEVDIPITFDMPLKKNDIGKEKVLVASMIFGGWFLVALLMFTIEDALERVLKQGLSFFIVVEVVRYIVFREKYYLRVMQSMLEASNRITYKTFWGIYEVTEQLPTIVRFEGGVSGMFLGLDKDVVVGVGTDNEDVHYEQIAEALGYAIKNGLELVHIDSMEVVGKDKRMDNFRDDILRVEHKGIKSMMLDIYDELMWGMKHRYASYDIYCVYGKMSDAMLRDVVMQIGERFKHANYVDFDILNRYDIETLVKDVFEIKDFNIDSMLTGLYSENAGRDRIKVIWVERDGERQRVEGNKTRSEIEEERKMLRHESALRRHWKKTNRDKKEKMMEAVLSRVEVEFEDGVEVEDINNIKSMINAHKEEKRETRKEDESLVEVEMDIEESNNGEEINWEEEIDFGEESESDEEIVFEKKG